MKSKTVLSLLLALLPALAYSQLVFPENFRIGDSTQVHVIANERGDTFRGKLDSWSNDSLSFQLENGAVLLFGVSSITAFRVLEEKDEKIWQEVSKAPFFLYFNDQNQFVTGKITSIGRRRISFRSVEEGYESFLHEEIKSISPGPGWGIQDNAAFKAILRDQKNQEGLLLGMADGEIQFLQGDTEKHYPLSSLSELKPNRGRLTVQGHERALFASPTGFNLKAGDWDFRNRMVFDNGFSYGVTDNISIGAGALVIIPYLNAKGSFDFGKYLHVSAGGLLLPGEITSFGWHVAASLGTPNLFLNFSRFQNRGKVIDSDANFETTSLGLSARIANRSRFLAEVIFLNNQNSDFFNTPNSSSNIYHIGISLFPSSTALTFGLGFINTNETECRFGDCGNYYQPYPLLAVNVFFGKNY